MLAPSTIFNTVISFMTNTNLQHYSGEVHLSNFSQIFFCIANMFLSASIGFCALVAMIRAFRGESTLGNFFVDMWRVVVYMFVPVALVFGLIFVAEGSPMTLRSSTQVATLEPGAMGSTDKGEAKRQTIMVGPVAALESIKMLGTNGGGFYGMNSAHPFENPTGLSNFFNTLAMMVFPFALVFMYGRMLSRMRHSVVIFAVMFLLMAGTVAWSVAFDTLRPNAGLTGQAAARTYPIPSASAPGGKRSIVLPAVAGLPVDQHLGNLEGKEPRFGTSAGATFDALTTDVTCGAVNAEEDSLNPMASLAPMVGMWLNCLFGGKGVGMVNMLLYIIIGIFIAGQMVGRTPEYLGRKIGAREVKLAVLALLVHPLMILLPTGLFAATSWGMKAVSNPGAHGFTQMLYQFSSASANNGSAFDGLGVTFGFANSVTAAATAVPWDIATGLVIVFSRFLPIIAPIAMAAYLGSKQASPAGLGTLRDDTTTFGLLVLGTVLIVGALLFLPVGGPVSQVPMTCFIALDGWLFLTVLFANFATALAEARGKAQADSLRKTRHQMVAFRLTRGGSFEQVASTLLRQGDRVAVAAGQMIPGDGEIIEGVASVDESAITGESAPVIREAGGDRSGVTGGTQVLSDRIVVEITSAPGNSFLDRMIALVEGAIRQRTPNEIALTLVLSAFTLVFLIVVVPLWPMAWNAEQYMMGYLGITEPLRSLGTDIPTLIALVVCLIPTTIGALTSRWSTCWK